MKSLEGNWDNQENKIHLCYQVFIYIYNVRIAPTDVICVQQLPKVKF